MNNYACPLGGFFVDNNVIRANATIATFLLILYLFIPSIYIVAYVLVDYAMNAFGLKFSPSKFISSFIIKKFYKSDMVDGLSKGFAVKVGFLFSLFIVALALYSKVQYAQVAAAIMAVITGLNAFLNYCMGCHMFTIICKIKARYNLN